MKIKAKIGFIGFGRMGSALAEGALSGKAIGTAQVVAYDSDPGVRQKIKKSRFRVAGSIDELVRSADLIFICVKPQQMDEVLKVLGATPLKPVLEKKCLVSIAAGITLARLARKVGENVPLIRVMPNTPALVRNGMSVVCAGASATKKHVQWVRGILESVGDVVVEAEHIMDAVTAVSGSGPAYVFYMAEAMTEAAMELGLSADLAAKLVRKTIYGSGQMLGVRPESARELRAQVTSPGGTTEAAILEFESRELKGIIKDAIKKAAERSLELSSD